MLNVTKKKKYTLVNLEYDFFSILCNNDEQCGVL